MPSAPDGRAGVLLATNTPPTAPAEPRAALPPATTPPPAPSEPPAPCVPPAPDAGSPAPPILDNFPTSFSILSETGRSRGIRDGIRFGLAAGS